MINCKGISNRGEYRTVRTPAKSVRTLANFSQGMRIFSRVKIKNKKFARRAKFIAKICLVKLLCEFTEPF